MSDMDEGRNGRSGSFGDTVAMDLASGRAVDLAELYALDAVTAQPAVDGVVAGTGEDLIGTCKGVDGVVPAPGEDQVGTVRPRQAVVAVVADDRGGERHRRTDGDACDRRDHRDDDASGTSWHRALRLLLQFV